MELFYRKSGSGEPIIILHGLYGSGDNWYSIGRKLAESHRVYLVDQRNHGNSPHNPVHNYESLGNDLFDFMQQQKLNKAIIIGHSMGGKAALAFGLKHPESVKKMIIVDISPLAYPENGESIESRTHRMIITALMSLDTENITLRKEADRQLSTSISSPVIRQFLLKNLKHKRNGRFEWSLNLNALAENMGAIFDGVIHEDKTDPRATPEFPLLFIKGERSDYIGPHDLEAIKHYFPKAEFIEIPNSGHWLHSEQPKAFLTAVRNFIK